MTTLMHDLIFIRQLIYFIIVYGVAGFMLYELIFGVKWLDRLTRRMIDKVWDYFAH